MHEKITMPNGVRILSEKMEGVRSAAIGIWVGVGSRFEDVEEAGSAHFIEHMLFKGTSKYTAAQLAEQMDAVGGQINAYTTRDCTCFYARVLDSHLPMTIDLLSDMFFDSNFDEADVKNETGIIEEEIGMYEDTPDDVVVEQLMANCFPGPLGRPVLGRPDTLETFTGERLRAFKDKNYIAPRIVVSLAGSFTPADIRQIEGRFAVLPAAENPLPVPCAYTPGLITRRQHAEQNQLVLAFPGLPFGSGERFAVGLMSGILGGNASSRLFQNIREKHGLCYSVFSFSASFLETGMFAIAAGTGRDTEKRAIELILDELRRLCDAGVTEEELNRSREQIKASMLMDMESTAARMNRIGNGELYRGGVLSPEEVVAIYDAITRDDILRIARNVFNIRQMSVSALGNVWDEDYYRGLMQG